MTIRSLKIDAEWITNLGEAHLVVAQVKPASPDVMKSGASRPWIVEMIRDLLGAQGHLSQIVSGERPSIVLLPELAVGFDDWTEIDTLVRGWSKPLILLTGFGFTKGSRLLEWLKETGPTERVAAWGAVAGPADSRFYNGGWCWVRRPDATTVCAVFPKITAEQHSEIQIEGLDQVDASLAVHLRDLIIFPVICSDLLSAPDGVGVVRKKITDYLTTEGNDGTRVLVAGMLLQTTESEKWRAAIHDVARGINIQRVNVCLANSAWKLCTLNEEADKWRDYSGVYIANDRKPYKDQFGAVRRFSTDQIDGAVVRATNEVVLGGPLRWSFNNATGRHLWAVQKVFGLSEAGNLVDIPLPDRFQFELCRILSRLTSAADAPQANKTEIAKHSFNVIDDHISGPTRPHAETVCRSLLFGEKAPAGSKTLNADTLPRYMPQIAVGLRVLGALKSRTPLAWQADDTQKGQLHLSSHNVDVLVWASPDTSISMRQTFSRWAVDPSRRFPLLAFNRSDGLAYATPHPISDRRRDISESPPDARRSVAEAKPAPAAVEIPLQVIENCYSEVSEAGFAAMVQSRLRESLQRLTEGGGANGH